MVHRAPKIAVIYYSTYGHVHTLAKEIAKGAKEAGAEVKLFQIPETFTDDILKKMGAAPRANDPVITIEELQEYDGYLFGFPTRYGRAVAQVSAFFDRTGGIWAKGALIRKFAGVFTSTASQHGGQETTALTTIPFFAHHGIIYVPIGYASPDLTNMDEIIGGSAYGASTLAKGDGSRQVSELELRIAKHQGETFTQVVGQYVR
ncbi:hypothetical protein BOTBODRAFT_120655 [Botryobasidium botryosum FD-172 SS1]|uniref:Flavodoxin-like domain-containing protein n=1 Tax=Botryobasidium botryosum (strain FD-172 SS1) TaxID=930990 RepID=A0A067M616_BOTB1|nr:hypothetical protein BOTBODRAFT_120655 [Botryobasidium botryosum FD-172 SS1]